MCGIAGAVGAVDDEVLAALERMHASLVHRGPDADGFWRAPDRPAHAGAAFAHRRLSIIDLSERGRQPMADPETGHVICFNGEVYNFASLRDELRARGCVFKSRTDTEVVLHAYGAWGDACVERLRGMFAFAVWDARDGSVFLARDRLGIKPLYLAEVARPGEARLLLFASEVRALLASDLVERRLSPTALASYLWNGFVVGPDTIVSGVSALPAGTTARVSRAGLPSAPRRYWTLPPHRGDARDTTGVERALEAAVGLRLVSDVPLGVFLSGGVDSSTVAALAARSTSAQIRTFNVSFDEPEYDESPYARRVADAIGAEHTDIRLTQSSFRSVLDDAVSSLDQPSFDAVNSYVVSRAVREAGITVALSGLGGDELFGGYRSFAELPWLALGARLLAPLPRSLRDRAAGGLVRALSRGAAVPRQTRWGKLADALATRGRLVELYQVSYGLFARDFLAQLAPGASDAGTAWGLPEPRRAQLAAWIAGSPTLPAISTLELACFVGERLLRDTDSVSMAVSLEVRVPLIDHEVVEAAAGLPAGLRYAPLGRKRALRDATLGAFEPALLERPKAGFVLPIDRWMRDALKTEIEQTLTDRGSCESVGLAPASVARLWHAYQARAPGIYWSRIWALFALLHWARARGAAL